MWQIASKKVSFDSKEIVGWLQLTSGHLTCGEKLKMI